MTDENTRLPEAGAVPLVELLQRVPADYIARWTDEDGLRASHSMPLGKYCHEAAKALAAHPRDDVAELLREARDSLDALQDISNCTCCFPDNDCCAWSKAEGLILRIDTALSQTDEQPAIPDMTDAECATAYRDLRKRANNAGFATVGEWIDEQPDTQQPRAVLCEAHGTRYFMADGCPDCAPVEQPDTDENAVTEYRVYSGSGHNGPKRFDNLADAVADAKSKAAVPSYMGPPGTMTPVQLIKHTVITEEICFRALAEGAGK